MITVHHLNASRSQRVLWMLEELAVPYEVKKYERDSKTMLAPPELKLVHPLGKAPVVTDGERTLAESGAILEYLAETYGQGKFSPAHGTEARMRYNYWMHYAEGSAMPPLLLSLVAGRIKHAPVPFFVRPITKKIAGQLESAFIGPQIETHFDFVEAELCKSEWFVGEELTAADIQMSFPLEAAVERAGVGEKRPKIRAFVERIQARPAYKRAIEKGGPFEIL
jgi:glutathione S-transferase